MSKIVELYVRELTREGSTMTINDVPKKLRQQVEDAIAAARKVNPTISAGICGEQGLDPESIRIFNKIGVSYVSVSPYGIPVARLAAGQAAIEAKNGQ